MYIGSAADGLGVFQCLDEKTGQPLWRFAIRPRNVPKEIDGRKLWFGTFPRTLGICSSPTIDGDRVYLVTHRCEVICLDVHGMANGNDGPFHGEESYFAREEKDAPAAAGADVVWLTDMWDLGVRPSDACDCSVLVHGDLVYVGTSNGVDRDADARKKDEDRKPPAPAAPNLIVLDKKTGRVVARDDLPISQQLFHGQWSSPSLGRAGGEHA